MDRLDETAYDVIVLGTGLTEAAVAAALARSGRRVLHLDALPYYGEPYSTHTLPALRDWLCQLSWDAAAARDASDERVSPATVDEQAVEAAQRVAEWRDVEVDKVGRPVVHDGLARGRSERVRAEAAVSCPRIYRSIAFEEALPPADPPPKAAAEAGVSEGVSSQGGPVGERGEGGAEKDEEASTAQHKVEGYEELVAENKGFRYNIDVVPKINLSMGPLIKALLKSGVGRYLEFMPLKFTYLHQTSTDAGRREGSLERVPMSKADIFQAKSISPIEKRLLMKFMQWCIVQGGVAEASSSTGGWAIEGIGGSETEQLGFQRAVGHVGAAAATAGGGAGGKNEASSAASSAEVLAALQGKSLEEVMREHKLTDKLQRFVAYGIVMDAPRMPAIEAIHAINRYAQSLGRYSESAFLCNYYGTSEIPQAFSRMCAVYGGTYVLRRAPARFLFTCPPSALGSADNGVGRSGGEGGGEGRAAGIICSQGQILRAPVVISSAAYVGENLAPLATETLSRCVCIAIVDAEGLCLAVLPPGACGNSVAIRVLQLDYTSQACPRGKYVWNLWAAESGAHDLRAAVSLLRCLAPSVTVNWVAYYSQMCWGHGRGGGGGVEAMEVREGLWLVPMPSAHVDSGDAILAAEKLFHALVGPEEDFLEAMPEPEVVEDDDSQPIVHLFQPKALVDGGWNDDMLVKLCVSVDTSGRVFLSIVSV